MSRTHKDNKRNFYWYKEHDDVYSETYECVSREASMYPWPTGSPKGTRYIRTVWLKKPGARPKVARNKVLKKYYWYRNTPSAWTHDFMTVPKRAKCRNWEAKVKYLEDFEECPECPDYGNKPHLYYW